MALTMFSLNPSSSLPSAPLPLLADGRRLPRLYAPLRAGGLRQALLERGHIRSFKEAFTKYIGRDGPAYVEREKVTPAEAVELVIQAKGLPVLAHPLTVPEPERMATELKAVGLVGIEAYYVGYAAEDVERLVSMANRHNLITTGGTDFHGLDNNVEMSIGGVDIPEEPLKNLLALARQSRLKPASP